ncbi:MAG: DUF3187 family protein [Deltaproteobacteria bacterium]|nr:DUF3187 family protein [Deltaproteobacteria bacterium]
MFCVDTLRVNSKIFTNFKWQLSSGSIVEFALIENVITFDNSPDFGLHLALFHPF